MAMPDIYPFHGDWATYVEELYDIYINDIVNGGLSFESHPIRAQFRPMTDGKGYGFWHIISDGEEEEDRIPDMRRCESLPLVPYCISTATQPPSPISWWKNKRGSNTHIVILYEEKGFVIVLAERKDYYLLKTAYFPTSFRLKSMIKERNKYWGIV